MHVFVNIFVSSLSTMKSELDKLRDYAYELKLTRLLSIRCSGEQKIMTGCL